MTVEENILLAPFTTLKIGGPARFFARITSEDDLLEAIRFARSRNLATCTLGSGSNLVVPDEGFPGLVLHMAFPGALSSANRSDSLYVEADAGTDWDTLVRFVCEQEVCGMECLAGIPGLVGGCPVQNIGAYGQEVSSTIQSVYALDLQALEFVYLPHSACEFSYRSSIFNSSQRSRYIIVRVDFVLPKSAPVNLSYADLRKHFGPGDTPSPLEVSEAVRQIRATKGMLIDPGHLTPDTRSAGSFFKNPIVTPDSYLHARQFLKLGESDVPHWVQPSGNIKLPAAWLIERAGFAKGFTLGGVGISSRHTLALVNRSGSATCEELLRLRDHIAETVRTKFEIALEQEPVTLTATALI